jgi:long-chain acyl-CoA synthetase
MGNSNSQCQYARFIKGTKEPGYSEHLVGFINLVSIVLTLQDPKKLSGAINDNVKTLVHAFKRCVKIRPEKEFLGSRDDSKEGRPYIWMTYKQCDDFVTNLARGFIGLGMMPEVEAEGRSWKFMGIYAKNRPEWVLTDLACSSIGGTTIAFYDTLGPQAIEFVINQSELQTITCAGSQLSKIILLKSQGKA